MNEELDPQPGEVPDFVIQFYGAVRDVLAKHPDPAVERALDVLWIWVLPHIRDRRLEP